MITLTMALMIALSVWGVHCENPVKLTTILLMFASLMFMYLFLMTGETWFPLIFYMLFMGGILIMFMILSSTMPNKGALKFKSGFTALAAMTLLADWQISTPNWSSTLIVSAIYHSYWILPFIIAIVLLYFFGFLSMLKSSNNPMKSKTC